MKKNKESQENVKKDEEKKGKRGGEDKIVVHEC